MNKTSFIMCAASALLLAACGSSSKNASPSAQSAPNASEVADAMKKESGNAPATQQVSNGYSFLTVPDFENKVIDTSNKYLNGELISSEKTISSNYELQLNGKTYRSKDKIDLSGLKPGLNTLPFKSFITQTVGSSPSYKTVSEGELRLYKQNYSVFAGTFIKKSFDPAEPDQVEEENTFGFGDVGLMNGHITPYSKLPKEGVYTYNGKAFNEKDEGTLKYTINFEKRQGSGSISGMNEFGNIKLNQASIKPITDKHPVLKNGGEIAGAAVSEKLGEGKYFLGIFGPDAQEVIGVADFVKPGNDEQGIEQEDVEVGFGGQR